MSTVSGLEPMIGTPVPMLGSSNWRMTNGSTTLPTVRVYWSSPGVLRHDYPQSEAPIIPQIEDWTWVWISGDWAVVVWCGSNPMLEYNGGFVLSRQRSDGTLPLELEGEIRKILETFGMKLEG